MKSLLILSVCVSLAAVATASAAGRKSTLVVTSTNAPTNELLVYDTTGALLQSIETEGQGGASSNAGGIAADRGLVAVVNFGSQTVSIFARRDNRFDLGQVLPTLSQPLSVAFGKSHLYVLGATTVESHAIRGGQIETAADGTAALLRADGSAAQVGVVGDRLLITEKSGEIELVDLRDGAVSGTPVSVPLPPNANDTPFGFVTRGANAYVTIAHSDAVGLVKNGRVVGLAATGIPNGGGEHSPCWIALAGPYLYSTNSPSHSISRLIATGRDVILDDAVAAKVEGAPIDVAADGDLLAVVETNAGGVSHLNQFRIDVDGSLTPLAATLIAASANGVVIVSDR